LKAIRAYISLSLFLLLLPCRLQASDAIWSDTLSASLGADVCRNPAIAVTGDTLWAAWETNRNGNWDIYARSYTEGLWSAPLRMTESDSSDLSPVLLRDRFGRMWFVWESKHSGVWKIYTKTFGGPIMTEGYAGPGNVVGSRSPDGCIDTSNRLWVVWQSPGTLAEDSAEVFAKYYDGEMWTEPFNITQHPADDDFPRVAVDSTGNVWVVWRSDRSGNEDIYATHYDGENWRESPLQVAAGPSGDFTPHITVDRRGRVWFAWMSNFNIFARYYDGGLSSVFQLTVGYYVHQDPCIIGDASSNLWVVWAREEGFDNLYGRYYTGESWTPTDTAAAFAGNDRSPALAVDWMDNLWQIWEHDGDILLRSANIPPLPPASGFEPAGGLEIKTQQPLLRWDDADEPPSMMHYVVQVDDSRFENGVAFQYEIADGLTYVDVRDVLADNTQWFYRVQTVDPTGLGSQWSEIQDFYVDLYDEAPHPPENFTIVGIVDGEVNVASPDFIWTYGGDNDPLDTAEKTWYQIQIDDELCWCTEVIILGTAPGDTTAQSQPLEENRTYYARIQALVEGEDMPSEWSDTLSFWINTENSAPQVQVLHPNGGEIWSGIQAVQWTAGDPDDDSSSLSISIDFSSDGGRVWESLATADAEGKPMNINDGYYLWEISPDFRGRDFLMRVTAKDPAGARSSDVSDGSFVVSSVALDCQPRLFSPNGDGQDDEVTISFALLEDSDVTVKVYDVTGRLVRHLMGKTHVSVTDGESFIHWDGKDEDGKLVPNRLYIIAATIMNNRGSDTRTKTVVVLNR
jgi:hypothetical protein